ncbi:MAG: IS1634 family transposase [Planctomycetaceae bacterium]|nr:IS1634 family transposase [Planctomycetaceae bacterium]
MDTTLELTHERVDDLPLLLGFLIQLKLPEILDRHLPAHPLHQGLSNGWLITVWIAYILSRADHRKSPVQAWAQGLQHTLETLIGQRIRPVEFNDDRLTLLLKRLADTAAWEAVEADLWHTHCHVYALPVERVRLDATTSCGSHTVTDDGLMQLGHSKDHRPDLAQFKLMAAVAEPTGLYLAGDVHPGNAADDPLYLPLYRRVRVLLDQTGLLYAGDCKMAALETRAEIAANQDFYLTRLPLTGTTQAQFAAWVEAAVVGDQAAKLIEIRRGEEQELIGRGYEFERPQTAVVGQVEHTWTERVQVIRSEAAAESQAAALDRRLKQTEAAVRRWTPPPGPGRSQFTSDWELERAVDALLTEQGATGLLTVSWERHETSREHYVGPGRGGPNRRKTTERSIRYQITAVTRDDAAIERLVARMGWQVQVTNASSSRLSLGDAVLGYRAGTCVERAFHQLKDQPLGIRPLLVHRDDQVRGLTHLLTLALRVLTLFEVLVRRGQDQDGEDLAGLYPGQPKRTTDRPTAQRVLEAIARTGVTLIQIVSDEGRRWHLTALPVLVKRVLGYLGLSDELYTRLVINSG